MSDEDFLGRAEADELGEALATAFERAGERIEIALGEAARSGEADFARMTESILQDLARLALDAAIIRPLEGALGNAFGALPFIGGRAEGGPVLAGGQYLVGERGPEVFTPTQSGEIGQLSPAVTVNLTLPAAPDRPVSEARLARQIARAALRGGRRL